MADSKHVSSWARASDTPAAGSSGGGWGRKSVTDADVRDVTLKIQKLKGFRCLPVVPIEEMLGGAAVPLFARSPDEFPEGQNWNALVAFTATLTRIN